MKARLLFLAALFGPLSLAVPGPEGPKPPPPPWYAMFWNVENLFDTVDDPAVEGVDAMAPADHAEKTKRLREVIRRVDFGRGPDILGLAEIESADLIRGLVGEGYSVVFEKGSYARGLNTGLATRLPLIGAPEFLDPRTTGRTILHAVLAAGAGPLHVFVLHLKSRSNPATATEATRSDEETRSREARFLRRQVDAVLSKEPRADLLLMGDWNEDYRDSLFREELLAVEHRRRMASPSLADDDHRLLNYGAALRQSFPQGGTCYYYPNWDIFDNLLLSEALGVPGGLFVSPEDAWIGVSFDLLDIWGQPARFQRESPTGVSDHLPVLLRIRAE
ncbi:MAG: endonuclease/exonuclease/phosphatase family protein [Planctomycetes bacterium]|jgi:endonuclease/exonuclease/phosphatase family metal-dependent hydrolase|nr:endonuclease/exonuclease/phosphatase family protein [Planctomycetota bacterium]